MPTRDRQVIIRLAKEEEERADRMAARKGLSRAAYIRLALLERIHIDEADPRLKAVRPIRALPRPARR